MIGTIFQFILSAVAVFWASRWLARASDEIARQTGLGHLFVGSLFLAASTSAPEFFVDIRATVEGIPNLAAGDLIGSSLVNLAIFSVVVLLFRAARAHTVHTGATIPTALLGALLTAEVGALIYLHPSDASVAGVQLVTLLIAVTYLGGIYFIFRKFRYAENEKGIVNRSRRRLARPLALFFAGALMIFVTSPFLVESAEKLAQATGLGSSFIGATLLALTTSFPELGSSIVAARMGLFDLVVGNILGSNAFNMLIFVFMDWIWKGPSLWSDLSPVHVFSAAAVVANMLVLAGFAAFQRRPHAMSRVVGAVVIMAVSFAGYALLYFKTRMGN